MTTTTPPIPDMPASAPVASDILNPKWWGHSLTIWGTLITTLSTVVPVLGPALGVNITGDLIRQLGDNTVVMAQAVGGVAGTAMAIWGRIRATQPIERRQFTLTL
jgi:hypothetical protein